VDQSWAESAGVKDLDKKPHYVMSSNCLKISLTKRYHLLERTKSNAWGGEAGAE